MVNGRKDGVEGAGGTLFTKTVFPVSQRGVEKPELPHRNGRWPYVNIKRILFINNSVEKK